jgi:hypothetical protein
VKYRAGRVLLYTSAALFQGLCEIGPTRAMFKVSHAGQFLQAKTRKRRGLTARANATEAWSVCNSVRTTGNNPDVAVGRHVAIEYTLNTETAGKQTADCG